MKRMEERQIQGLHRMAGRWAANCLWASVSLFFVHFVLSCLGSPWDPAVYGDVLIKSPVWFRLMPAGAATTLTTQLPVTPL